MDTKSNDICLSTSQQLTSSCVGALLTSLLVTPFDVVKIRLQAQRKTFAAKNCFMYCNGLWDHMCYCSSVASPNSQCPWYKRPSHFRGTSDALLKIIKYEGVCSLWSGLPPTLIMAVPATMLYFTTYEKIREKSSSVLQFEQPPLWLPSLSGAFARVITVSAVSPLEFIRTKLQSENIKYSDVRKAIRKLIQKQGIFSLWHGLGPTVWRDVPFSAIYWTLYEFLKQWNHQPVPSIFFSFFTGATSGMVAAVLTLPFDVVKTHRQIELGEAYIMSEGKKKTNTIKMIADLYNRGGFKSVYSGLVPRVIKIAPACAIMISTYEYGKCFFIEQNVKKATRISSIDKIN